MTRMLRIGEFARLTGLSVRTLRFYDAASVLRPAEVDALTGYRLYALHQLQIASRIIALRRLGLQLDEVREALTGELAEREMLAAARERLERSIVRQSSQLVALRARLEHPDLELADAPVGIRLEPSRWVASVSDRLSAASDVAELFVELRRGLDRPSCGREGVLWHRCAGEGGLTGAAFVEVPRSTRPRGRVSVFELPSVEMATVRTVDDDDAAELGYRTLSDWMTREGHALRGPKREMPLPAHPGWLEISFPFRAVAAG
ncbi:MAG TPA: MerR family transcriptional regulator [Myxococcaceae bacterium]|nr:MerR family transcriptional regulator [Myxococcaceae bacterium]